MMRIDGRVHVMEDWTGTENNDTYHGTEDGDLADALAGNDSLFGEGGDDTLHGGPGNDFMFGGDGNDTIYDTDGNDDADGGSGDDDITLGNPNGSDTVNVTGGSGRDRITVSGHATIDGGEGNDSITVGNCVLGSLGGGTGAHDQLLITANVEFEGNFEARKDGVEVVSADHSFTGDGTSQRLDFSNTSAIDGFTNGLEIFGQGGDDTLQGTARADTLHGGAGGDRLLGGDGNDQLYGDGGADSLIGGNGDDTIHANGADQVEAGDGNDTTILTDFASADAGDGDDVVDCNGLVGNRDVGGGGTDTLAIEVNSFFATDFDMFLQHFEVLDPKAPLYGSDFDNRLNFDHVALAAGATGATIYGQGGDDSIQALDSSNDQVHGGSGDDHLWGGSGDDVLWGDAGHNTLEGGDGNDTINGGPNDVIVGGRGNDGIEVTGLAQPGLPPAEVLGGGGDDIIGVSSTTLEVMGATHRPWHAPGVQKGGIDGGAGTDTLVIGGGLVVDADTFLVKKSGFEILDASFAFDCGSGANLIDVHGVTVTGTLGGAWTNGEGGDDTLIGSDGQDRLIGGSGSDDIQGGAGADSLFGSDGDDTLEGGAGDDSLQGEGGSDTLSYVHAAGAVTVSLAITGAQNTGGAGSDTAAGFENLTGSRYGDQLTGDSGANVIIGGIGSDTLTGNGGADTFQFAASDSIKGRADLITDLQNADVLDVGGITHAFHLVGSFTGAAGEATLTYDAGSGLTTLAIDVDGDARADSVINMTGDHTDFTNFVS